VGKVKAVVRVGRVSLEGRVVACVWVKSVAIMLQGVSTPPSDCKTNVICLWRHVWHILLHAEASCPLQPPFQKDYWPSSSLRGCLTTQQLRSCTVPSAIPHPKHCLCADTSCHVSSTPPPSPCYRSASIPSCAFPMPPTRPKTMALIVTRKTAPYVCRIRALAMPGDAPGQRLQDWMVWKLRWGGRLRNLSYSFNTQPVGNIFLSL
jgi:hypothetical protein